MSDKLSIKNKEEHDYIEEENQDFDIGSYGADYSIENLVCKLERQEIYFPFIYRDYFWTEVEASRFIESILLGLPVPGIFLTRNIQDRLFVIDGQQRLKSLLFFINGEFKTKKGNKVFKLKNVQTRFEGLTFKDLDSRYRDKLFGSIIHATIIKQNSLRNNDRSLFNIFQRLNTGGRPLTSQEIRIGIYPGNFNNLIEDLNRYNSWRNLLGEGHNRLKDREMILRFFAMYYDFNFYRKPLKKFLDIFNSKCRNLDENKIDEFSNIFKKTCDLIMSKFDKSIFKLNNKFNYNVLEVVMVTFAKRVSEEIDFDSINNNILDFLKDKSFEKYIIKTTSDEEIVKKRYEIFNSFINKYVSR